ncbi:hypothetical protein CYLTODRAFT_396482 [Cylindrobasidium torrendii FP15055 ss-10]|uniref:Smr domain-containing protein n=1 Tax=Cylindrobasidium torrendii FP15055 ss-10 TaxID=1314674 RepID=A0A0D7BDX6_9AGAR|nr:hypothetical protein CYLTODRAFT_396482 [Cylindrobasidium torrendii FP15055 ss-10]
MSSLFDKLEAEFCPPLDSSLLAAILLDITLDSSGAPRKPTQEEIDRLRTSLRELSSQAELCAQFEDIEVVTECEDSADTPSLSPTEDSTTASSSAITSSSTPLGFLQAALPHIDTELLDKALSEAQVRNGDADLWDVIAGVLTTESIREMEERGLDEFDYDEFSIPPESPRQTTKPLAKTPAAKRKKKNNTVALSDIRQQHHVRPSPIRGATSNVGAPPSSDAWSQLSSLATHVASLVTMRPTNFYISYFHSPAHSSPYIALLAALTKIQDSHEYTPDEHIPTYLELLNIILPMYDYLDTDVQSRMVAEAELCVVVTEGRDDDALNLVILLRELDADSYLGYQGRGIYHSPQSSPISPTWSSKLADGQTPVALSPVRTRPVESSIPSNSSSTPSHKPSAYQWQAVPRKKVAERPSAALAMHIPAYNRDVNGNRVKRTAPAGGQALVFQRRMSESMRKREDMLREASRAWNKGRGRARGGEVALFFAERARQFQEMAKKDALELALLDVQSRMTDPYTVDLHGTTAVEGVYVVREIVKHLDVAGGKPLTVITGRGSHSVNNTSVLKPAVRKALTEDGYTVSSWDAGLHISRR